VNCAKATEPIKMPFEEARIRWGVHTTEPSMCGSNVAFMSNYYENLLNFGALIISLKRVKLGISNLVKSSSW